MVAVTTAISVAVGMLMTSVIVLADEPTDVVRHAVTTHRGVKGLLATGSFASLPVTIPTGVIAGLVVARIVGRNEERRSTSSWIAHGCAYGAMLGVGGVVAWLAVLGLIGGDPGVSSAIVSAAPVGAVGGIVVGGAVGAYASCEARGRRMPAAPRN